MYDELKQGFSEQFKDFKHVKTARWDLAIKALLSEKTEAEKPLSVGWLSECTKLSVPYLSNLISGKIKNPPSDKLIRIAEALKITFPELSVRAMGENPNAFFKTGFGQRGYIEYSQHGFSIQSLSPPGTSRRDFFFGLMTIKPLKELKRWKFQDNSMIGIYLEQGTLEIVHGGKIRKLHSNESAYFDGSIPHRFKNLDTVEARLFLATRPPIH